MEAGSEADPVTAWEARGEVVAEELLAVEVDGPPALGEGAADVVPLALGQLSRGGQVIKVAIGGGSRPDIAGSQLHDEGIGAIGGLNCEERVVGKISEAAIATGSKQFILNPSLNKISANLIDVDSLISSVFGLKLNPSRDIIEFFFTFLIILLAILLIRLLFD